MHVSPDNDFVEEDDNYIFHFWPSIKSNKQESVSEQVSEQVSELVSDKGSQYDRTRVR